MKPNIQRLLNAAAILSAVGTLAVISGCGNTLSGAKQDATDDTQKAAAAADTAAAATAAKAKEVGSAVKAVPENAEAATILTPIVKTAIIRDPVLDNSLNLINVNSADKVVHLTGHVLTDRMKQRAEEDTQNEIDKKFPGYTVSDELTVKPPSP